MCECPIAEFYRREDRVARKAHVCDNCYGQIPAGSTYAFIAFKVEGEVGSVKACYPCLSAIDDYQRASDCCVGIGELRDALAYEPDWPEGLTDDLAEFVARYDANTRRAA